MEIIEYALDGPINLTAENENPRPKKYWVTPAMERKITDSLVSNKKLRELVKYNNGKNKRIEIRIVKNVP